MSYYYYHGCKQTRPPCDTTRRSPPQIRAEHRSRVECVVAFIFYLENKPATRAECYFCSRAGGSRGTATRRAAVDRPATVACDGVLWRGGWGAPAVWDRRLPPHPRLLSFFPGGDEATE